MKKKQKKGEEIKTHLEFPKWIKTATPKKKNKLIRDKRKENKSKKNLPVTVFNPEAKGNTIN